MRVFARIITEKFYALGYNFNFVFPNGLIIKDKDLKTRAEIDIVLENAEYIIAVEVKAKPVAGDIGHHIRRLEILRETKDAVNDKRKILGAIAGAIFSEELKTEALDAGFYVLEQTGDTMRIKAPEAGRLREW